MGHGVGVAPGFYAVYLQPSVFTLAPMAVVFIVALAVILGVPALRNDSTRWPPSLDDVFLHNYGFKFVFFGVLAALLVLSTNEYNQRYERLLMLVGYGLFFAGAILNFLLCYRAVPERQANPWFIPLLFAAPSLLVAPPPMALMWYGSGAIGGLIASDRVRAASWVSFAVFAPLMALSVFQAYYATVAPDHVLIEGGVVGNALMAALFAAAGIAPWVLLLRAKAIGVGPP